VIRRKFNFRNIRRCRRAEVSDVHVRDPARACANREGGEGMKGRAIIRARERMQSSSAVGCQHNWIEVAGGETTPPLHLARPGARNAGERYRRCARGAERRGLRARICLSRERRGRRRAAALEAAALFSAGWHRSPLNYFSWPTYAPPLGPLPPLAGKKENLHPAGEFSRGDSS
jgi:hypothetical protein